MPNESKRTVFIAIAADLGVALAKLGAAVFTGSSAMAAAAADSLADTANDLFLLLAQRRSTLHADDRHPLGYGREAYSWALFAAIGVFIAGAAFSLREGIDELIHPSITSSFGVAYVVLAISAGFDLVSIRQSAGQMSRQARREKKRVVGLTATRIGLRTATTRAASDACTSASYMIPTTFRSSSGEVGLHYRTC